MFNGRKAVRDPNSDGDVAHAGAEFGRFRRAPKGCLPDVGAAF